MTKTYPQVTYPGDTEQTASKNAPLAVEGFVAEGFIVEGFTAEGFVSAPEKLTCRIPESLLNPQELPEPAATTLSASRRRTPLRQRKLRRQHANGGFSAEYWQEDCPTPLEILHHYNQVMVVKPADTDYGLPAATSPASKASGPASRSRTRRIKAIRQWNRAYQESHSSYVAPVQNPGAEVREVTLAPVTEPEAMPRDMPGREPVRSLKTRPSIVAEPDLGELAVLNEWDNCPACMAMRKSLPPLNAAQLRHPVTAAIRIKAENMRMHPSWKHENFQDTELCYREEAVRDFLIRYSDMPAADLSSRALGCHGEAVTVGFLNQQGWQVLARNWRTRAGELDIVAQDPAGTIVFIEVKALSGRTDAHPLEKIGPAKIARVKRAAAAWLKEQRDKYGSAGRAVKHHHVRFDAVGVTFREDGAIFTHIPGALQ